MSGLPDAPEPTTDSDPDEAPGGPADRVERDGDDFPLTTPDPPRSAQVDDDVVPDELDEPDDSDKGDEDDADEGEGLDPSQEHPV